MSAIAIVYTTTTGNTLYAAELLQRELGGAAELVELNRDAAGRLADCERAVCCVSSWGRSEMQDDWEAAAPELRRLFPRLRRAAILGMGDQKNYPDAFADGVGRLAGLLRGAGVELVGQTACEGYSFNLSKAVEGRRFLGLVIDEDNQHEQTLPRIRAWAKALQKEFAKP